MKNHLCWWQPSVLMASIVRCHLNKAVPTGHVQSTTNLCELLQIIWENLQNANFCKLKLLEVCPITTSGSAAPEYNGKEEWYCTSSRVAYSGLYWWLNGVIHKYGQRLDVGKSLVLHIDEGSSARKRRQSRSTQTQCWLTTGSSMKK